MALPGAEGQPRSAAPGDPPPLPGTVSLRSSRSWRPIFSGFSKPGTNPGVAKYLAPFMQSLAAALCREHRFHVTLFSDSTMFWVVLSVFNGVTLYYLRALEYTANYLKPPHIHYELLSTEVPHPVTLFGGPGTGCLARGRWRSLLAPSHALLFPPSTVHSVARRCGGARGTR